jgi:glutamyl-tRNA synthetase
MADTTSLAQKLFPTVERTVADSEAQYPPRRLAPGAPVTRFAPSPTGFMHIGGLFAALISERIAHQGGGVFFVRIEDTDKKREVAGATDIIRTTFAQYGINVDEGLVQTGMPLGAYGPYLQSERLDLYATCAKHLVAEGRAYPCFCTSDALAANTAAQEAQKVRPGYRGAWARCRTRSVEEAYALIQAGTPYVIRLRSEGDFDHRKVSVEDSIKGTLALPENDLDTVLLKSDGYPTYHFAHIVDDHFMHTTHVIRGDEWLSSTPLHLELWNAFGWTAPHYGHIAPIQKVDAGGKRKLSKRKDPEADMRYYDEKGYPAQAVIEYLLNLANSNFEDWRKEHPTSDYREFSFSLNKLNVSGALFDEAKLMSISKELIACMPVEEMYTRMTAWLTVHDSALYDIVTTDPAYTQSILGIEKEGAKRKDIRAWSDARDELAYFFDTDFRVDTALLTSDTPKEVVIEVFNRFLETYDPSDDASVWFGKVQTIATTLGYAENLKAFKQNPTAYKGHVGSIAQLLRIAVTSKTKTPDLHTVMHVLGEERVRNRIQTCTTALTTV